MPVVPVNIPGTSYDVTIEPGLLSRVGEHLAKLSKSSKTAIISDSNVGPLHARTLMDSLKAAGIEAMLVMIPAGEQHKNLATLLPVYEQLLSVRIERSTPILALGGGVVGDMAGFVAATILRGVPFVQVPTTLLAMVDASIGGKTGVDTKVGKNLIGAFYQPMAVLADPAVLKTLPLPEIRGGLAECIKHDIIRDADGFAGLEKDIGRAVALDIDYLSQLVAHNVAIKARVVAADPYEKGERARLNLGHTFAHAIESISNYSISHGHAVALGISGAAFLAKRMGLLDDGGCARIRAVIQAAGLSIGGLTLDSDAVVEAMTFDKKVQSGRIRFILPNGIGAAVIRQDVPLELVREAVGSLRE